MVEKFGPHPKMKTLFFTYLAMVVVPLFIIGFVVTYVVWSFAAAYTLVPIIVMLLPITLIALFAAYWIPKYYDSITFELAENEIRVEMGVWWKMRHAVPFSRVMSIDTIQGPLSRSLGIGTVDIYTAGYTGVAGGTGGPGTRRAEASIIHVAHFLELRERILQVVGGRPLFGAATVKEDIAPQMLRELQEIKKLLSK